MPDESGQPLYAGESGQYVDDGRDPRERIEELLQQLQADPARLLPPQLIGWHPRDLVGSAEFEFDLHIDKPPGGKLGIDCFACAIKEIPGLMVQNINEGGIVDLWNQESQEPHRLLRGDLITRVNEVAGSAPASEPMKAQLRAAQGKICLKVWGLRAGYALKKAAEAALPPTAEQAKVQEKIRLLQERTRVCTKCEWEETYMQRLNGASPQDQCSICQGSMNPNDKIRGMACGHIFHFSCLGDWFMADRSFELSCPLCRSPLASQGRFPASHSL